VIRWVEPSHPSVTNLRRLRVGLMEGIEAIHPVIVAYFRNKHDLVAIAAGPVAEKCLSEFID